MMKRMLIATLALAGFACGPAQAQGLDLKMGHVAAPGSLFEASANEFARRANAALGKEGKVSVFGSSQLGNDQQLLQKLKLGTVDFSLPSTVMSSVVDEFGMFEMPYLVKDRAHMARIEKEILWPKLEPKVEAKGYKILAVWENGFRNITNNKHPIVKPADLAGLKLRTPKGKWRVKMFQAYGASPSPMAFSEVFTALKTGVMDGQENPLIQIYSAKFQEVQKYLSLSGHVYTPAYVLVGLERWKKLPPKVAAALEKAAKDTQAFVYQKAAAFDKDLLDKLKAGGIKVNEVDKKAFIEASKPIYQEFGKDVPGGGALVEQALKLGASS